MSDARPTAGASAPARLTAPAHAELRLPAHGAYVAVLRMTAAGLASRLDFTVDDLDDLRMAVGEACALLLDGADPAHQLTATFELASSTGRTSPTLWLRLATRPLIGSALGTRGVDVDTFGWQVLLALADEVVTAPPDVSGEVAIELTARSSVPG